MRVENFLFFFEGAFSGCKRGLWFFKMCVFGQLRGVLKKNRLKHASSSNSLGTLQQKNADREKKASKIAEKTRKSAEKC